MSVLIKLDAGFQNYAWGKPAKESFVARMKGLSDDTSGKMYAELWVGTHASCPSSVRGEPRQLLSEFLKDPANAKKFISPAHFASSFKGVEVPYLLKILSINTALSIQAHPNKALAEKLHASNPDKYKDPNHKPELICALTPMEALCCFRSLQEIAGFLKKIEPLAKLLCGQEALSNLLTATSFPPQDGAEERAVLKTLLRTIYAVPPAECTAALRQHLAHVQASASCKEDEVFARVYSQYTDDVGCWMVYILNYVQMQPGQALFLSDSEPHAYISGEGVEIMACSDNVVRAGLTPKWKDVGTLVEMLKYSTSGLSSARHECKTDENEAHWQVQYYQPPAEFQDFSIYRMQYNHEEGNGSTSVQLPTIGLGFCVEGEAKVNGSVVHAGDVFAVPYGTFRCEAVGRRALVFVSSTNQLTARSKV